MIITAIGQTPDISFTEQTKQRLAELKTTRWNTIDADPTTLQCNIPYLFAAGDSVTGPSLVVEAIGGGRRAARSIHQYVRGEAVGATPKELAKKLIPESMFEKVDGISKTARATVTELPVKERIKSFAEVDLVLSKEDALKESNRCLSCGKICYNPDLVGISPKMKAM